MPTPTKKPIRHRQRSSKLQQSEQLSQPNQTDTFWSSLWNILAQ